MYYYHWPKRRFSLSMVQFVPFDICKPRMVLNFLDSIRTKSLIRISQYELNDSIFTLLMKSKDVGDHLKGNCSSLTVACLASI